MGKKKPNVTPGFGRKPIVKPIIKLDLGCGPNKREGFLGVDVRQFDGKVDVVHDLTKPWPWKNESVMEVHCSHFIEHLEAHERVHFINELYRVLVPGGKCTLIAPYAFSERAYGDMTHKWPPVVGFWFYYLDKPWRTANAPHSGYNDDVDFLWSYGYSLHGKLAGRNQEYIDNATLFYKEACQDIQATLEKRVPAPATT